MCPTGTTRDTDDLDVSEMRLPDEMYYFDYSSFKFLTRINNISDYYKIGKLLGKGGMGEVRLVTNKKLNYECAMKIIPKA